MLPLSCNCFQLLKNNIIIIKTAFWNKFEKRPLARNVLDHEVKAILVKVLNNDLKQVLEDNFVGIVLLLELLVGLSIRVLPRLPQSYEMVKRLLTCLIYPNEKGAFNWQYFY